VTQAAVYNTCAIRTEGTEPISASSSTFPPRPTGSCLTPSSSSFTACALRTLLFAWCLSSWRMGACLTTSGASGAVFQRKPCWECAKMCVKEWLIWNKTVSSTEIWYVGPRQVFPLLQLGFSLCFLPSLISAFTLLLPIHWQGIQYRPLLQKQHQYFGEKKASLGALINLFPLNVFDREETRTESLSVFLSGLFCSLRAPAPTVPRDWTLFVSKVSEDAKKTCFNVHINLHY